MPRSEQHVEETDCAHLSPFILTPALLQFCCFGRVLGAEGLSGQTFSGVTCRLDTRKQQRSWLVTTSAPQGQQIFSIPLPLLQRLRLDVLLPAGRRHETLTTRAAQGRYGEGSLVNDVLKILRETACAEPTLTASINAEFGSTSNAFRVLKTDHAGG